MDREILTADKRGRVSLKRLGFEEGTLVAERLDTDENAWVIRPGRVVTEAELEVISNEANVQAILRASQDVAEGRTVRRHRHDTSS